jgi:hypothetical protein
MALLTKAEVEAMNLGSLSYALHNGSDLWLDENNQRRLTDIFAQVRGRLYDEKIAVGALLVRYIVVSNDFDSVVAEWQGQDEAESRFVDSTRKVEVLGKNFTWGDGTPEHTYGVIFLREYVATALIGLSGSIQDDSAEHTLAHELAHSHEQLLRLITFGQPKQVYSHDWEGIKLIHAKVMWAEYVAERAAHQCFPNHSLFTIEYFMSIFEDALDVMSNAIEAHRTNHDTGYLWNLCGAKTSDLVAYIGRTTAVLNEELQHNLLREIAGVDDEWVPVIESAIIALQSSPQSGIEKSDFFSLCDSIESIINTFGIFPHQHSDGDLVLDIPERE